jgi:hypothetical protein
LEGGKGNARRTKTRGGKHMKEILGIVGIVVIAVLFILGMTTKVMPLLEDLRVVEPTPGIECAIVSRIAHTSIDCWKIDEKENTEIVTYLKGVKLSGMTSSLSSSKQSEWGNTNE